MCINSPACTILDKRYPLFSRPKANSSYSYSTAKKPVAKDEQYWNNELKKLLDEVEHDEDLKKLIEKIDQETKELIKKCFEELRSKEKIDIRKFLSILKKFLIKVLKNIPFALTMALIKKYGLEFITMLLAMI